MPAGLIILGFMLWGIWKLFGYILLLLFICFAPAPQPVEVPEPPAARVVEEDKPAAGTAEEAWHAEQLELYGTDDVSCDGPN